jgi:type II secretory pathway pseudopilin PulG
MRVVKLNKQTNTSYVRYRRAGFSYVEILLAAVIISVLLVSALRLFGNIGRSRQTITEQDLSASLALQMIEEIKQLPYRDPLVPDEFGPGADETANRAAFDDIDDYDGWTASPPQSRDGTPLNQYVDLTRSVTVRYVAADNFELTAALDEGFKEVTIIISKNASQLTQQKYVIADAPGFGE